MATLHHHLHLLLLFFARAITPSLADDQSNVLRRSQKPLRRPLREKLSHLLFYLHDIANGPGRTGAQVVRPASNATGFGSLLLADDPLTVGPAPSSKLVGRAQGFYCVTAQAAAEEPALLMSMTLAFLEGKYNGSTVVIIGRNPLFSVEREMPVVGGSGLFRLARGYAQLRTHSFDLKTGNAVVEYNLFIMHY